MRSIGSCRRRTSVPTEAPDMPPNYITPEGARRLQEELAGLYSKERPKVVGEVADAAAQGDRSENAEYIYGKKRLREIDRRIHFLTKRLEAAVVVAPGEARADGVVFFGAIVEVEDEDGERARYQIVGEDEIDLANKRVSWRSPIGSALLKRRVGDTVNLRRPSGDLELMIISVSYG
jgi:transcription elongation factor GreB